MYAKYIKKEMPDLNGTGQTLVSYKMQTTPMSHKQFVDKCSREGHMDAATIEGVLALVAEKLALFMAEGYSVKLDGIGTFLAKLGMRGDALPDTFEAGVRQHNAKSIQVSGVSYRPDNSLVAVTRRKCTLVSGGESRIRKSRYTQEQRIDKARQYLREHTMMRVADYAALTGLSRTTASLELRRLVADPASGIMSIGQRSQKYYILRR